MKAGRNLQDLAAEIERQADSKRDFIAPAQSVTMTIDEAAMQDFQRLIAKPVQSIRRNRGRRTVKVKAEQQQVTVAQTPVRITGLDGSTDFGVRTFAHGQIADKLGIPKRYYDRLATEAPGLLVENVNHWLHDYKDRRMFRVLDGNVRAFLSDSYRRMDYFDFLSAVLPIIKQSGMELISCQVTERKLYLKCVNAKVSGKVVGDVVQAGVVFTDSEVGCGKMNIQQMIYTLRCTNGMVGESVLGRAHLGRTQGDDDKVQEMLKDTTKEHSDQVLWESVRDVTEKILTDQTWFDGTLAKLNAAADDKIMGDVPGAIVELQKQTKISEKASSGILRHLIEGGDLSKWGVSSAVTRYSQDVDDYDEATELEQLGHKVIELPKNIWESIAQAEPVKSKSA